MDTGLFHLINSGLTTPVLDVVMPFITDFSNFHILAAAAVVYILARERKDGIRTVVFLVLAVAAGDLLSDSLKTVFMRARPCRAMEGVRLLVGCGPSYSFPSGHATNIFAAMVFLSLRYRRRYVPAFLLIAVLVSYSRVYVGVHYPLDVAGGAALGSALAFFFTGVDRRWAAPLFGRRQKGADPSGA